MTGADYAEFCQFSDLGPCAPLEYLDAVYLRNVFNLEIFTVRIHVVMTIPASSEVV